jgi:hypothetical protein
MGRGMLFARVVRHPGQASPLSDKFSTGWTFKTRSLFLGGGALKDESLPFFLIMEATMKLEVGKLYKTKSGQKVRIYSVGAENSLGMAHGAIQVNGPESLTGWLAVSYDALGKCVGQGNALWDLEGEWT